MPAYHKKTVQLIEKSDLQLPIEQLTLADLRTAVGIQALMTLMDQDDEALAGRSKRQT
jgi:hypothetical protein